MAGFFMVLSYAIFWASRFLSNKKAILNMDNLSRLVTIVSFLFLDSINGIQNTLFILFRNEVGKKVIDKPIKVKYSFFYVLLGILLLMYLFSFNGLSTICLAVCGVLNLIGTIFGDEQQLRLYGLVASLFYMAFLFLTGSLSGCLCEGITFLMIFLSWKKYNKVK